MRIAESFGSEWLGCCKFLGRLGMFNFDRAAFHRDFSASVARFFRKHLVDGPL
jgi:hypothetical protein